MSASAKLTIELDEQLAQKLSTAAGKVGLPSERIAADCVAHHFELSARFLALVERMENMDNNLAVIAEFVGKANAPSDGEDLWKICRYRREKEGR